MCIRVRTGERGEITHLLTTQFRFLSLPALVLSAFGSVFALWAVSRLLDDKPYLFNNGELGYLEKRSVYVKGKKCQ